jgi:hypothetical protein
MAKDLTPTKSGPERAVFVVSLATAVTQSDIFGLRCFFHDTDMHEISGGYGLVCDLL